MDRNQLAEMKDAMRNVESLYATRLESLRGQGDRLGWDDDLSELDKELQESMKGMLRSFEEAIVRYELGELGDERARVMVIRLMDIAYMEMNWIASEVRVNPLNRRVASAFATLERERAAKRGNPLTRFFRK